MENVIHAFCRLLVLTCTGLILAACDSGSSGGGSSKSGVDASGTWFFQSSAGIEFTADITQNDKNLGGSAVRSGGTKGLIAGTLEGTRASFAIVWENDIIGTYNANVEGTTMSGTFEEEYTDHTQKGTFVATR